MPSRTNNSTKVSIPRHLSSPNIRAGYLLNDSQFPFEPFLLRTTHYRWQSNSFFLTIQPSRSAREAIRIRVWRENCWCDKVYCSVVNVLTVQFSLTRFRARNDCCYHLVKLLKFKYLSHSTVTWIATNRAVLQPNRCFCSGGNIWWNVSASIEPESTKRCISMRQCRWTGICSMVDYRKNSPDSQHACVPSTWGNQKICW